MLPTLRNRMIAPRFGSLFEMPRDFERLFANAWPEQETMLGAWEAPTDIIENKDELRFVIEVPGLSPEEIDVNVENNVLTVSGEKRIERKEAEESGDYRLFERRYGRFQRSFVLPRTVDSEQVKALYEHGVLTIRLPKTEDAKPRRIAIESHNGAQQVTAG